jgi:hypothetical protein
MSDDKVINIKTRRKDQTNPSIWLMIEQLVATVGVKEVVHVMADISHDLPALQLMCNIQNTPEISQRVDEILSQAIIQLEELEDSQIVDPNTTR